MLSYTAVKCFQDAYYILTLVLPCRTWTWLGTCLNLKENLSLDTSLDSSFVNLIFEGPLVTKALEQKQMQWTIIYAALTLWCQLCMDLHTIFLLTC
jgi:hypothetical protein